MAAKKKGLTREQAAELYKDLQRNMAKMLKNEAEYYKSKGMEVGGASKQPPKTAKVQTAFRPVTRAGSWGSKGALLCVTAFALSKVILSGLEYSGLASVSPVEASSFGGTNPVKIQSAYQPGQFSREEVKILTSLDTRRAELEERNKRLDEREQDLQKKDKEFALRITQLRELNDKLASERAKNDKRQSTQLDQLANVYGSMNPSEAAKLMEQLDVVTAMSLIERMPEKRIAQILSTMTPERALELTRMLSGKAR